MPQLYAEGALLHVVFLTFILGCGCAWLAGRAIAETWRPARVAVAAMILMGLALRFLHFASFDGAAAGTRHRIRSKPPA